MRIETMVKHYKNIFNTSKEILEWLEHDLKHMGMEADQIRQNINEAKKYLEKDKIL